MNKLYGIKVSGAGKRFTRVLALVVGLALVSWGSVALATNKPIPGIDIVIKKNPGGSIAAVRTDKNGSFEFKNLPEGNYELTIPGQPSKSLTVGPEGKVGGNLVQGSDGQMTIFDRWGEQLTETTDKGAGSGGPASHAVDDVTPTFVVKDFSGPSKVDTGVPPKGGNEEPAGLAAGDWNFSTGDNTAPVLSSKVHARPDQGTGPNGSDDSSPQLKFSEPVSGTLAGRKHPPTGEAGVSPKGGNEDVGNDQPAGSDRSIANVKVTSVSTGGSGGEDHLTENLALDSVSPSVEPAGLAGQPSYLPDAPFAINTSRDKLRNTDRNKIVDTKPDTGNGKPASWLPPVPIPPGERRTPSKFPPGSSGILVRLEDAFGHVRVSSKTDKGGAFNFSDVPEGKYKLKLADFPDQSVVIRSDRKFGGNLIKWSDGQMTIFDRWGNLITDTTDKGAEVNGEPGKVNQPIIIKDVDNMETQALPDDTEQPVNDGPKNALTGFGTGMNGSPGAGPALGGMGGMNPMMGPGGRANPMMGPGGRANPMMGPGGAAGPGSPMMGGAMGGGRL